LKHWLPIVSWLVALAALVGAAQELRRARDVAQSVQALDAVPQLQQARQTLTLAEYQAIQSKVAPIKSVNMVASEQDLTITAAALSDYQAWRLTIDRVIQQEPSVHWRIAAMCSGQCVNGQAHRAVLVGERVKASVVSANQKNGISGSIGAISP
jgi:hypothetical protein